MGFLSRLLLGNGTLKPRLRAELEAEGLVLIEEGCLGSIRYHQFRAPGKRFDGKITGVRLGIGISERRMVAYSHSGRAELIDSPFDLDRLRAVAVDLDGPDALLFTVDYAQMPEAAENGVSGLVKIRARTPRAPSIVEELHARMPTG